MLDCKRTKLSALLAMSLVSSLSTAELTTPQAVLNNDGSDQISANSNFREAVFGDLYIATVISGQFLFLVNAGEKFSTQVAPYAFNQEYSGVQQLFVFPALGIPAGRYPLFQVVTKTGTNPFDVNNWIGGMSGLSKINFMIGLPVEIHGDFNADGFADDDKNRDGFHDDDLNTDGYHDDDSDKDGFHDTDSNKNGIADDNSGALGADLYALHCSACHGEDPAENISNILRATDPANTRAAINLNKGGMAFLSFLSDMELQMIADYMKDRQ